MFMGYLVQTGWKLKKLKHTGTFACIFDRHAKTFATDAGRYVGWGRHSLRFQHITLIQEILATTWTTLPSLGVINVLSLTQILTKLSYFKLKYPPCCDVIVAIATAVRSFFKIPNSLVKLCYIPIRYSLF
jgi:hypothetical protein